MRSLLTLSGLSWGEKLSANYDFNFLSANQYKYFSNLTLQHIQMSNKRVLSQPPRAGVYVWGAPMTIARDKGTELGGTLVGIAHGGISRIFHEKMTPREDTTRRQPYATRQDSDLGVLLNIRVTNRMTGDLALDETYAIRKGSRDLFVAMRMDYTEAVMPSRQNGGVAVPIRVALSELAVLAVEPNIIGQIVVAPEPRGRDGPRLRPEVRFLGDATSGNAVVPYRWAIIPMPRLAIEERAVDLLTPVAEAPLLELQDEVLVDLAHWDIEAVFQQEDGITGEVVVVRRAEAFGNGSELPTVIRVVDAMDGAEQGVMCNQVPFPDYETINELRPPKTKGNTYYLLNNSRRRELEVYTNKNNRTGAISGSTCSIDGLILTDGGDRLARMTGAVPV